MHLREVAFSTSFYLEIKDFSSRFASVNLVNLDTHFFFSLLNFLHLNNKMINDETYHYIYFEN